MQAAPPTLLSIAVTPPNPTIQTGATQPFTATGTYSDGSTPNITTQVTWASSSTAVATITTSGLATAGVSAGNTTISATLSGKTGSTVLTVQAAQAPTLLSIAVTPPNPTIQTGATQPFTATGTYSDGSTPNITTQVTWASSSTAVATITTSGLATAGVSAGNTTISATLSGKTGSTVLTVQAAQAPTLLSIAVTPPNPTIQTGATQPFTATGTYSDGSTPNITTQVTWASSSTAVATITTSGLATAGVSAGNTTISATLSGKTGSTVLTVQAAQAPTLLSIAVTPPNPTIQTGATQPFTATGTYSDGSTPNITTQVTWASSSTAVATITTSGLATAGVSAGNTTISATLSGKTGSTVLTVQAALVITTPSLPDGTLNVAYSATLSASGGTPPYTWSIVGGSLPKGLKFNTGVISGTPKPPAGSSSFTARVTATGGATATKAFTITVRR